MNQSTRSRSRTLVTSVVGLALAFVVGTTVQLRADSGGVFCGYGDCWLTYDGCSTPSFQDDSNGECTVTFNGPCSSMDMSCDGGAFGWVGLAGYSWGLQADPVVN